MNFKLSPLRIVIYFTILSFLWIISSDLFVSRLTQDPALYTKLSIIKGWLYVLVTGLFLYSLIRLYSKQRTRMEADLRESEERYCRLVERTADLVTSVDSEGRFTFVNSGAETVFGITADECIGRYAFDFVHPEDRKMTKEWFAEAITSRKNTASIENRQVALDGKVTDVLWTSTFHYGPDGSVLGLDGIARDITDRKLVEENLLATKQELLEAQRIAHLGSWNMDLHTAKGKWSDESYRIFGFEPGAFEPTFDKFMECVHSADRKTVEAYLPDLLSGKLSRVELDLRIIRPSGEERIINIKLEVITDTNGKPLKLNGISLDITERKRAEQVLNESEEKFRNLFNNAEVGIFRTRLDGSEVLAVNRRFLDIVGMTLEETIGKPSVNLWADPKEREEMVKKLVADGSVSAFEYSMLNKRHGEIRNCLTSLRLYPEQEILEGTILDITERKRAEEALRESERLLRESQIIAGLGNYILDIPTGLLTCSDIVDKLFGIDKEYERSVEGWLALIHPDDRAMMTDHFRNEILAKGKNFDKEYRIIRHNDHAERWVHGSGKIETDIHGRPLKLHGTVQDITDRKNLEEQLRQTQKLEAIGTLAGGIAHDFNNLLQGVFGYISIAKLNAADKDKSIAALEQAEKALHMSVNLTTQLLTFSKGGKPIKKKISLQPLIENSVKFALSGSRVNHSINMDDDLMNVNADEGQISQVIQNIVLNADQAMPIGGTIKITAKNVRAPIKGVPQLSEQGRYVEIAVQDSGIGISKEYLPKIFDPYFTTKAKGSGLGLATCYSIIKNHDGVIHVASKVDKGATFYIYLPAVQAGKEIPRISEPSPFVRKVRILLMDDEELIRNIAGDMIKLLEHEVEFAEHGKEAVEKYKTAMETGNPFDIVILDLTVRGGMGGRETIEQLLSVNPGIKAVVSSGYSDDPIVSDHGSYGFCACLSKPYTLEALRDVLNNLLR